MTRIAILLFLQSAALFLVGSTSPVKAASLHSLGNFPGSGNFAASSPVAISPDGRVVVGNGSSSRGIEAFRWTAETGVIGLGDFEGGIFNSRATGVSADGSVVVGWGRTASIIQSFRWTSATGLQPLQSFGGAGSAALALTPDGQTAVGFYAVNFSVSPLGGIIFRGDGTYTLLDSQYIREAVGISADGSVVIGNRNATPVGRFAYRWSATDGYQQISQLPGASHHDAAALSAHGRVVVGYADGPDGIQAFRWTVDGGIVSLGDVHGGSMHERPAAVSEDGSVIGGRYSGEFGGEEAFIWHESIGMRPLSGVLTRQGVDMSGWRLYEVTAISADGKTVAGRALSPDGDTVGFRAILDVFVVPEPSSIALLSLGGMSMMIARRRFTR